MKKALFIMALYLVPFFSLANIFSDGTVDVQLPFNNSKWTQTAGNTDVQGYCESQIGDTQAARNARAYMRDSVTNGTTRTETWDCEYDSWDYAGCGTDSNGKIYCVDQGVRKLLKRIYLTFKLTQQISCPPEDIAYGAYQYEVKFGGSETPSGCAYVPQIQEVDSCNAQSGNEYLTIPVTQGNGCYTQTDGSICSYNSVDVGGGNSFYAMDLEGDCYTANGLGISLNDNGNPQPDPVGEECVSYGGGVLGCPTNPSDVCSSGSSFAGGSIADCQTGCGMVNDQFLCIDLDTDSDGLPDYNDPDIDGDGIPNADDLDSNGDGKDDPINGGSGSGDTNLDLTPLVSELKKTNESLDTIEASFKTDHGLEPDGLNKDGRLDELNNDYQLDLEEFIAKGSSELGYTDKLVLGNSSSLSALPSNTCNPYSFHVAGKTLAFDVCPAAEKAKPILYWLVGMLTAWHIFFLINATLRGPI